MTYFYADGPAEDLYGLFINRVRRERGDELAYNVKGCISSHIMHVLLTSTLILGKLTKVPLVFHKIKR